MRAESSSGAQQRKGRLLEKAIKGRNESTAIDLTGSPISVHSSSEEEDEFEEVDIPSVSRQELSSAVGTPLSSLAGVDTANGVSPVDSDGDSSSDEDGPGETITLEIGGDTPEERAKKLALALRKKPLTSKDRAHRMEVHKMHVIALLASARIRNRWASNLLLQCRLLSLLPHPLHAAFLISPRRYPDKAQRSRLFFDALQSLVTWWSQEFFDISDPLLGQRTRTWDEVQEVIGRLPPLARSDLVKSAFSAKKFSPKKRKGKGKGKKQDDADEVLESLQEEFGGENLRTCNSLMKKALQQEGSRDISAQLFVSLARACGLGARLVVSIQAVPWRAEKVAPKKARRTKASKQGMGSDLGSEGDGLEEVPIPGAPGGSRTTGPQTDLYRLRKQRPPLQTLGGPKRKRKEDMMAQPPVFWAEIYSRSDQRWIPVDPVKGIIRKKAHYEPSSDSGPVRMVYIVAFEEGESESRGLLIPDGYARDVTLRYAKNFGAKTSKLRPPPPKTGEDDWWSGMTKILERPIKLRRDELEDAEMEMSEVSEGMPLHMNGFKDHPIYVLERHLKRDEVIRPLREIGRFKGEAVYRRKYVLQCKTAEGWMRIGRQVKERQEPMKWVKQRAVTLEKRRAQELAIQENQEPILQGLYSQDQTELYIPPPIKDGIIPQNTFGNIDLYVPTMLPAGAVHLPYKGIAKVAKQMKISYAEAVTSFEFKKQRALPVITGIVVAQEKEDEVLQAYWKSEAAAEERDKARREERALKRWAKLVNGLRIRLRLQAEYGGAEDLEETQLNPMAMVSGAPGAPAASAASIIAKANKQSTDAWVENNVRDTTPEPEVKVEQNEGEPAAMDPIETEPATPTPTKASRPQRAAAVAKKSKRGKKRQVDEESENEPERPQTNGRPILRLTLKATPTPAPAPTGRVTRSRGAKTEEQQRKEAEQRARVQAALASDDDSD